MSIGDNNVYNSQTFYDAADSLSPSTIKVLHVPISDFVEIRHWEMTAEVKGISKCHFITISDQQNQILCEYSNFCSKRSETAPSAYEPEQATRIEHQMLSHRYLLVTWWVWFTKTIFVSER